MSKFELSPAVTATLAEIPLDDDDEVVAPVASSRAAAASATTSTGKIEQIRIVLVGDPNVGKTEFANCFKTRVFSGTTVSSIGMGFTSVDMRLCVERIHARVDLYDTAGQERYGNCLMRTYYTMAKGVIIVFDPQNADSLVRAQKLYAQITEDMPDIVCMFVANKIDLFQGSDDEWAARLTKLRNLFTPKWVPGAEARRSPSDIYLPEELELPLKTISLLRTPAVALDLVAELAQRILMNRAAAAARAANNPLSPRGGDSLRSSKLVAKQQRQQFQQSAQAARSAKGTLRIKRMEQYNKDAARKKTLGQGGFCFF